MMEVWVGSCSLRHPTQTSLVFSFLCLTILRATLSDYYRSSFYQPNTWNRINIFAIHPYVSESLDFLLDTLQ